MNQQRTVTISSPAKINLFLAVTGRRGDGYHDLVSIAAQLDLGDLLTVEIGSTVPDPAIATGTAGRPGRGKQFSLECGDPEVPLDGSNLVLKAAEAFVAATGWKETVAFRLAKRIPVGAGLGGGSSNGAAALLALNDLSGANLGRAELGALAAGVGSDCPLFLEGGPVIMRGRGERIEPLPELAARRLRGRALLVFKPGFAVSTPWAYERMAAGVPQSYLPAPEAEQRLNAWIAGGADAEDLLFNNLEPLVFRKYIALPVLLDHLRRRFSLAPMMSGSGSACFALLRSDSPVPDIVAAIREAWGPGCFVRTAAIAQEPVGLRPPGS